MHRLADVEVQSVMQLLDVPSRLRLAMCSRQVQRCVSNPFAWQCDEPLPCSISANGALPMNLRHSMLRFAPVHVQLDAWANAATVQRLQQIPVLRSLCLEGQADRAVQAAIFALPNLRHHLHSLELASTQLLCYDECLVALAGMVQLRTLSLNCGGANSPTALDFLASVPALTNLSFRCQWSCDDLAQRVAWYRSMSKASGLKRLTLLHAHMVDGEVPALLQLLPALTQLEHLSIVAVQKRSCGPAGALDACDAALAQLSNLHTLEFANISCADRLLPHLAHLPALRRLAMTPNARFDPSAAVLRELLTKAPQLHVGLSFDRLSTPSSDLLLKEEEWRHALLECAPGRVDIS